MKVLEEEGLDSDGAIETTSKLRSEVLATSGVDILTDSGAYKSTYQILLEIAEVWDQITDDKARAGLLELLAGKRNSSVIAALLQNPEDLKAAYEDAMDAEGSALKENERYLDSIQGKIDQFNNAMQAMWSDTLESDVVKGFVELATQLIKIVDAIGPLNIALVGFFTYLEKKHGILSNFFKPAEDGVEALKQQLAKAEKDLAKATQADTQHGNKKTAQNRRDAEERVAILKSKIQESSSEAVLDGIDESFDPGKVKKSIGGKKGAVTKRAKKLESEGMSFAQIQEDPKIKQWTQEVKEGEQALNDYNAKVAQADATLKQKNTTTAQAAGAERAKAGAEAADASATNAGANADRLAAVEENKKTAATWADVWATLTNKDASLADVAAKIKQVLLTKILSMEYVKNAIANGTLTAAQIANMTATQLLALGFKGLAVSIATATKNIWLFMTTTPIGWILLAVGAVVALGAAFAAVHKTTAELKEELDGFKSELSDIRSELDSVNSELETTNERMEELLAKDTLTFEEQEELDRLRATNDELERRKELLEDEEEYKSGLVGRQAAKVVDSQSNSKGWVDWLGDTGLISMFSRTNDEKVSDNIEDYRKLKSKFDNASSLKEQEKYQEKLDKKAAEIDEYILELSEALDGVEYGDSEESDAALDYLAELQDNYGIARGSAGAKTNAIKGAFKKPEFESMSKAIDYYVGALKDGDESASESIAEIINDNKDLVEDLKARGLEAQDAIDYFTKLGDNARFDTLEGKTEEIKRATEKLPEAFNNIGQFMDGDTVDKTAIADYFKGTSDKTREEIAKLIQDINDGNIDVENALKKFDLFGVQSVIEIEITEVQTNFKDAFTDLDNADGLIDTFQELADAIGSTSKAMDALNAAQAEMDYSGRVSIETALKLMESTDDYSKVLTISNGKLVLAENAEENLIDARLEGMKTSALKALEDAKAARETTVLARSTAETALTTYNSAIETEMAAAVTATAWDKVLAAAAGLWAGIKSLFTDESWTEAYDRAYQETLNSLGGDRAAEVKAKYATAEEQAKKAQLEKDIENADKAIAEQDKEIEKLQGNYDLVSGLNKDNIGDVFKSDDLEDPDAAKEKKLDEKMEQFQKDMDYWENRIGANQARYEQIQNEIDLLEAKGQKAGAKYYKEQIKLENERTSLLTQQKAEAQKYLDQIIAAGNEGSEEFWEVANTINDIEGELDDVTASIQDLNDAMADTHWYMFDEAHDRVSTLTSDLENIRDILSNEELFDDEGNFTKEGLGTLASYVQELGVYEGAMADARKEMELFGDAYDPNKTYVDAHGNNLSIDSEQDWYEAAEKAEEKYDEWNQKVIETRYNIKDLYEQQIDSVEEYTSTLVENYQDYIDVVKEALDSERDLYEFKKSTEQKSKNIASIERRIASLSGSTNAADVAERRKLQAELTDAKSDMDDHYYSHAKDQQSQALDEEATAYEAAMNAFIESLHTKLEESTAGLYMSYEEMSTETKSFVDGVTESVVLNAGNVKDTYLATGETIDDCLVTPWTNAAAAIGAFASSEGALGLMNSWTESKAGAPFYDFQTKVSGYLSKPWSTIIADGGPVKTFKTSVNSIMSQIVSDVQSNVSGISGVVSGLQTEIDKIKDTTIRITTVYETQGDPGGGGSGGGSGSGSGNSVTKTPEVKLRGLMKTSREMILGSKSFVDANTETINGVKYYRDSKTGYYYKISDLNSKRKYDGGRTTGWAIPKGTWFYTKHAKGTTGTTRDEWAITDEPKFGDELTMYATPEGTLSFMRAGSTVIPADLTRELIDLPKVVDGLINRPKFDSGINMIANAINKPEIVIDMENFLKVDRVDKDTLPQLEAMMDKKIDTFAKQLNYSIKKFAR